MANIPPIPYKTPMLKENGFLTQAWDKFFLELFNRVGGAGSSFDGDLVTSVTENQENIDDLLNRVSAIEQENV